MSSEKIKKSVGRPKKNVTKDKNIHFLTTSELKQKLDKLAEQKDLSVSLLITTAITEYINKPENKKILDS